MKKRFILTLTMLLCMISVTYAATYQERLVWDANTERDLAGYNVYRLNTDDGKISDDVLLNTDGLVTETTYVASGEVPDNAVTTVCWAVTAVDTSSNESAPSNTVCETFDTIDTTPPAPPTGLIGTLVELIIAALKWLSNFLA